MKELIGISILIATLFSGSRIMGVLHNKVRRAALEKATHGLPALVQFKSQSSNRSKK
jgi:hypothetical protein